MLAWLLSGLRFWRTDLTWYSSVAGREGEGLLRVAFVRFSFTFNYASVCVCLLWVSAHGCSVLRDEGHQMPTGHCELPDVGDGNWTWGFWKRSRYSWPLLTRNSEKKPCLAVNTKPPGRSLCVCRDWWWAIGMSVPHRDWNFVGPGPHHFIFYLTSIPCPTLYPNTLW